MQVLDWSDLEAWHFAEWRNLFSQSVTPPPFLSPSFAVPAVQCHLASPPRVLTVESDRRLIGLWLFEDVATSRRMPLPHWRSWQTCHTYQTGLLIHQEHASAALNTFWQRVASVDGTNAVEFPMLATGSALQNSLLASSHQRGVTCWQGHDVERAALQLDGDLPDRMLQRISSRRMRSLRRGQRFLEKQGELTFQILTKPEEIEAGINTLLELEAAGWKRAEGTALSCNANQEQFFRAMIHRFALMNSVFFTQLSVDGKPVAVVAHLRIGQQAYAFKMGWDPAFERGCPGYLIKAQLIQHAEELPRITSIDSCSQPGSFIEHLWPDRLTFATHLFMTSRAGRIAGTIIDGLRTARDEVTHVFRSE